MMNIAASAIPVSSDASDRPSETSTLQRTSADWLTYFRLNRETLRSLPWDDNTPLTEVEKRRIAHSISYFQLGESSEGAHLMQLSRHYAEQTGDRHWVEVVKLFIGEEQRHARDLSRFMHKHQLPLVQKHWSDTWFRKLRRLANLEVALMVLLTAELVAILYYPALGVATRSPLLRDLCEQIHHDETRHVEFQSETLQKIWRSLRDTRKGSHPQWRQQLTQILYGCFFRATLIAVWISHASVLQTAGYSFATFFQRASATFHDNLLAKSHM